MFFVCKCGTQGHLNSKLLPSEHIINLMCVTCFKKQQPNVYLVTYELAPLHIEHQCKVFAPHQDGAIEICRHERTDAHVLQVELLESYA